MISIICCSASKQNIQDLENNISQTIGCQFEFLPFFNQDTRGICSVYNEMLDKAKYSFICLIHDDILFSTQNWGSILTNNFQNFDVLGVAGGKYKTLSPSNWGLTPYFCYNLIQHKKQTKEHLFKEDNSKSSIESVVCLDGVFIASTSEVFKKVKFDSLLFKGFHGYDYDFSIHASQYFRLGVMKNILIEHRSEGRPQKEWIESQFKIAKKWSNVLPLKTKDCQTNQYDYWEMRAIRQTLIRFWKIKYFNKFIILYILKLALSFLKIAPIKAKA